MTTFVCTPSPYTHHTRFPCDNANGLNPAENRKVSKKKRENPLLGPLMRSPEPKANQ